MRLSKYYARVDKRKYIRQLATMTDRKLRERTVRAIWLSVCAELDKEDAK